jgi:hypothetical protein
MTILIVPLTLSGLVMVTVSMVVVGAILLSDGRLELKENDAAIPGIVQNTRSTKFEQSKGCRDNKRPLLGSGPLTSEEWCFLCSPCRWPRTQQWNASCHRSATTAQKEERCFLCCPCRYAISSISLLLGVHDRGLVHIVCIYIFKKVKLSRA